jgi:2-phosphosulfolactate phosphatase
MSRRSVEVFSTAQAFQEDEVRSKTVVVIDVLRASSSMVTALVNGAKGIIPVEDMSAASKIAANLDAKNVILCGEKDGYKIDGFQLGNSPMEYSKETVEGRTLILNTTNGTKAVSRASLANRIFIGCFLNAGAVVEQLHSTDDDIILICAGWKTRLSLEDMLCAGLIVDRLNGGFFDEDASDGAKIAHLLYKKYEHNIELAVRQSSHARRLDGIAHPNDISYCSQIDIISIVPHVNMKDGIILP